LTQVRVIRTNVAHGAAAAAGSLMKCDKRTVTIQSSLLKIQ